MGSQAEPGNQIEQIMANDNRDSRDNRNSDYVDKTVQIKRCAAVVKGGRRFSFAALVVVGDGKGKVGWGYGKANEVPPAVEKAQKQASRNMVAIPLVGADTIPHYSRAKYGSADVMLMPADAGTGVIAGSAVRAVCEFAFRTLALHRLEAACIPDNGPSRSLLAKAGFTEEGFAQAYLKINGVWRDHVLFGQVSPLQGPEGPDEGVSV